MNLIPNLEEEDNKNHEPRKTIVWNKYEYGSEKITRE